MHDLWWQKTDGRIDNNLGRSTLPIKEVFSSSRSNLLLLFLTTRKTTTTLYSPLLPIFMGIPLLWPFIRQEGYEATLLWQFPLTPLPPDSFYRVDILACFFSTIQRIYSSQTPDQQTHHITFERYLQSRRLPKDTALLYIDGPSPDEKRTTREARETKRALALQKAQACIGDMEERVGGRRRLRKRDFSKLHKLANAAFYWSLESRKCLAEYLASKGWNVTECHSEADTAIAIDCQPNDIVLSGDSDMLVYNSVEIIWRPLARGQFLVYKCADVLRSLDISRAQLTALGVVSKNDYTSNLTRLGVATNFKIVKSLGKIEAGIAALSPFFFVALIIL